MANTSTRNRKSSSSSARARSFGGRASVPLYNDMMNIAGSLLRSKQEAGAEKISSVAEATRNFAGDFGDIPNIQTYVHAAAEQLENLSEYVADNSLEQMVADAGSFAKRNPIATMAFAAAAGFGVVRMMAGNSTDRDDRRLSPRGTKSKSRAASPRKRSAATSKAKANGRDISQAPANV